MNIAVETSEIAPALRPELPAQADVETAFRILSSASVARLHETAHAFLAHRGSVPTHQLRVALRRHRCLLKSFGAVLDVELVETQNAAARSIGQRLSPIRELDVLAEETLPHLAAERREEAKGGAPGKEKAAEKIAAGLEALAKKLSAEANRKRSALRRSDLGTAIALMALEFSQALADGGWRRQGRVARCAKPVKNQSIAKQLGRDARGLVGLALDKALRKLSLFGERMDQLTIEQRHEMRKKAKVLRYQVEFFGSLYEPEAVKTYRRALKQLQKSFGALNDAADAMTLGDMAVEPALRPAIKAAIARSEEKMRAEFGVAAECWILLETTPRFWG